MARSGKVHVEKKETWLHIQCASHQILIKGLSQSRLDQIEGNALAYGDIPFNATGIQSIQRVTLDASNIKPIEDSPENTKA